MSAQYAVFVDGLDMLDDFDEIPAALTRKAVQAINKTVRWGRTRGSKEIREQVAFKARYLTSGDKLETRFATKGHLAGRVVATDRATSLARFVTNASGDARATNRRWRASRSSGAKIQVKPGATRTIRRAFAVNLRGGNIGLAVRTDGGPPRGAYKPKLIFPNVWLLYGPSVAQVFNTVRGDISEDTADYLETEFTRLLSLGDAVA